MKSIDRKNNTKQIKLFKKYYKNEYDQKLMGFSDYYEDQSVLPEKILSLDDVFMFTSEAKKRVLTKCKFNPSKNFDCEG